MAEGQPRGGCFRCGSPHHSNWECRVPLDQSAISANRRTLHDVHFLQYPEEKSALGNKRMASYFDKKQVQSEVRSISWNLIGNQASSLLDFLLARESDAMKLEAVPLQLDGLSSLNKANQFRQIHDAVRSQLENARLLIASEKVKSDGRYNVVELNIIRGRVQQLATTRDRVFGETAKSLSSAINLHQSIMDLLELRQQIIRWAQAFLSWMENRPAISDLVDMDGQLVTRRANFTLMIERARFIGIRATYLQPQLEAMVNECKNKLDIAGAARSSLENKQPFCRRCRYARRVEIAFKCGHSVCRVCYEQQKTCLTCPP